VNKESNILSFHFYLYGTKIRLWETLGSLPLQVNLVNNFYLRSILYIIFDKMVLNFCANENLILVKLDIYEIVVSLRCSLEEPEAFFLQNKHAD